MNAFRICCVTTDVEAGMEALRGRLAIAAGGTVNIDLEPFASAPRIYPCNREVDGYNTQSLEALSLRTGNPVFSILASHAILLPDGRVSGAAVPAAAIPGTADECGGLEAVIKVAEGARVMLRRNIACEDALVNGAIGTVRRIELSGTGTCQRVEALWIHFDNPDCGRSRREALPNVQAARGEADGEALPEHGDVAIYREVSRFKATRPADSAQAVPGFAGVCPHRPQDTGHQPYTRCHRPWPPPVCSRPGLCGAQPC